MALILDSKKLQCGNGIMPEQTSEPFIISIGDYKKLVVSYKYSSLLPFQNSNIYVSPALFVDSGLQFTPVASKPNSSYFLITTTTITVASTWYSATFVGKQNQKNYICRWQLNSDKTIITIELYFYATADQNSYLSGLDLDNSSRFLKNRFSNTLNVDNSGTSVYQSGGRFMGFYVYSEKINYIGYTVKISSTQVEIFAQSPNIFSNSTTSASDMKVYINGTLVLENGDITIATTSSIKIIGDVLVPIAPLQTYKEVIMIGEQIGYFYAEEDIIVELVTNYIEFEGLFYNEGDFTNPVFTLTRSATPQTTLSSVQDTLLEVTADLATAATDFRYIVIKTSNTLTASDFLTAYEAFGDILTPSVVDSDTYKGSATIPYASIKSGETYRVIAIFYDSANEKIGSFISDLLYVDETPDILSVPGITSTINHYSSSNVTNAMSDVAVFDRYECFLEIDKTAYEAIEGVGQFNPKFLAASVELNGVTGKNNIIFSNGSYSEHYAAVFNVVSNTATTLILRFKMRIKLEWANTEIVAKWSLRFSSYPQEITFLQKFQVNDIENNLPAPFINFAKLINPDTNDEILVLGGDYPEYLRVESNIDGDDTYKQIAIRSQGGNVTEYESFVPDLIVLPTQQDAGFVDVDEAFVIGNSSYRFTSENVNSNTILAVIAKLSALIVEVEIYTSLDGTFTGSVTKSGLAPSWIFDDETQVTINANKVLTGSPETIILRVSEPTTLTEIDLSGEGITGLGDFSIFAALELLDLRNNDFTVDSMNEVLQFFDDNLDSPENIVIDLRDNIAPNATTISLVNNLASKNIWVIIFDFLHSENITDHA